MLGRIGDILQKTFKAAGSALNSAVVPLASKQFNFQAAPVLIPVRATTPQRYPGPR